MRKDLSIITKDDHLIPGTLDSVGSDKLVILVHGLTGNQHEHQYFNAVPFFNDNGFDVFRFDFYTKMTGVRKLVDSSIQTHISDLETVLEHFEGQYESMFLVGHSIGASIVALCDHSRMNKIVLWDPSTGFDSPASKGGKFIKELGVYLFDLQMQILLGKDFVNEWQKMTVLQQIENIVRPKKVIFAGAYNKLDSWGPYMDRFSVDIEWVSVPGATHRFIEEGALDDLYEETLKWIEE